MAKYLTREQVLADFKITFMPKVIELGLKESAIEQLWHSNLKLLCENRDISESQRDKWVFPRKELLS